MRAVVLHSTVAPKAPPDEQDVLVQARLTAEALERLGWEAAFLTFGSDLGAMRRTLRCLRPDLAVNLVETVEGTGRLIHTAPALLEAEGIPYTGCPADAVFLTSHKILAKKWLTAHGLPTPEWFEPGEAPSPWGSGSLAIVKPLWEDASVGIDQDAVVSLDRPEEVRRAIRRATRLFGPDGFFVERFIDGREFNLAFLADPNGVQGLPVAEMCFVDFGPDRHRIVDYEAKWAEGSFAERHTVRSFAFPEEDGPLLDHLGALARRCWDLFGLRGYARVDFRVDAEGVPWILEINANPCLSPDAGFMAAARQAGLDGDAVIRRIVEDALGPRGERPRRPLATAPSSLGKAEKTIPTEGVPDTAPVVFRTHVHPSDPDAVERITRATGFFNEEEIAVARDLACQNLTRGSASGYHFIFAEHAGSVTGYTCYGPILGTAGRYDLFWIVVDPAWQHHGVGRALLNAAEQAVRKAGGRRIYVETSSRALYEPTRRFYLQSGYALAASLPNFYGPGDHKIVYFKKLN